MSFVDVKISYFRWTFVKWVLFTLNCWHKFDEFGEIWDILNIFGQKRNFWIVYPFIFQTSFMGISWKYKLLACACAFVKQRNVLVKLGFRPRTQVASVQKALFVSNLLPIYLRHRIREREGRRKRRSWMAEEEGKESSISEPIMGWLVSAWHTRFHFYPWSRSLSWAQGLYWI